MFRLRFQFTRRASAALLAVGVTATAAGAATAHRFDVSQTTGSLGAQAVVQTTSAGGAFQGEVGSSANTSIKLPFGVLGEYDASSSPAFGVGVVGISTTGYGVGGEALGSQPSVIGYAGGTGPGVEGITPSASMAAGVYGYANGPGPGGYFYSTNGNALTASTPGSGGFATLGTRQGTGVLAYGYSGESADPVIAGYDFAGGSDLLGLYGYTNNTSQENFIVQSGTLNESGYTLTGGSDVQVSGDLFVTGRVFQTCDAFPAAAGTNCSEDSVGTGFTLSAKSRSARPERVATYGGRQSLPTVEDFGQAQIVGGRAVVRLDPAFAATIDPVSPYLVFVTPEGDSPGGVFTSNHTRSGFEVRENAGGRSTMLVDYRIVAKPLGDRSQRFAALRTQRAAYAGTRSAVDRHLKDARPAATRALIGTTPLAR